MKNIYKVFMSIVALVAMQSVVSAQIGYSITDNNRDATGLQQQYYQFDLSTGQGTLISELRGPQGQTIRREYEGLGSSGSILLGVSEFDTELCNTGSDPITGLSSDVRIFRTGSVTYPQPNGVPNAIGPQIGETCFPSGFTEAAAAYNQVDGFLYAIASDDLITVGPRSRLFRVSPTTGLATPIGGGGTGDITLTAGSGGDENPYLDGLAILPDGRAFGSEARFTNNPTQSADPNVGDNGGLYRIFLTGPNTGRATFVKYLLPTDANRDTGLANNGNTLYLLLEDARVFTTDSAPSTVAAAPTSYGTLATPGCLRPIAFPGQFCGDFEGFDIPNNGNGVR